MSLTFVLKTSWMYLLAKTQEYFSSNFSWFEFRKFLLELPSQWLYISFWEKSFNPLCFEKRCSIVLKKITSSFPNKFPEDGMRKVSWILVCVCALIVEVILSIVSEFFCLSCFLSVRYAQVIVEIFYNCLLTVDRNAELCFCWYLF